MTDSTQQQNELQPIGLYETSFHLPNEYTEEDLRSFLETHRDKMPGLEKTEVILRKGKSNIDGYNHWMVPYLFESIEAMDSYINDPKLSEPVRNAFTEKYGKVVQGRKRYRNGVLMP